MPRWPNILSPPKTTRFTLLPFDHFIVVDWSSRATPSPKKPSKDAIWLSEGGRKGRVVTKYFRTREACHDYVSKRLKRLVSQRKRVLVGWDFAFGYPKGFAKALRLDKQRPWKGIWALLDRLIKDNSENKNNRFTVGGDLNRRITGGSGPFWGVPSGQSGVFLGSRKDFSYPVSNRRVSLEERRLVELRKRRMQPPWKLAYTGSVGSQALLGIPRVYHLANKVPKLKDVSLIWPFETRFTKAFPKEGPLVLHAEIYPSSLKMEGKDGILDREQVRTYIKWLRREQADKNLMNWLAGPDDLSKKETKQVLEHEGWVLGIE